jgi:hypothetical protein
MELTLRAGCPQSAVTVTNAFLFMYDICSTAGVSVVTRCAGKFRIRVGDYLVVVKTAY